MFRLVHRRSCSAPTESICLTAAVTVCALKKTRVKQGLPNAHNKKEGFFFGRVIFLESLDTDGGLKRIRFDLEYDERCRSLEYIDGIQSVAR